MRKLLLAVLVSCAASFTSCTKHEEGPAVIGGGGTAPPVTGITYANTATKAKAKIVANGGGAKYTLQFYPGNKFYPCKLTFADPKKRISTQEPFYDQYVQGYSITFTGDTAQDLTFNAEWYSEYKNGVFGTRITTTTVKVE